MFLLLQGFFMYTLKLDFSNKTLAVTKTFKELALKMKCIRLFFFLNKSLVFLLHPDRAPSGQMEE